MSQTSTITLNKLGKQYAPNSPFALKDLTLTIDAGEVFGFLGPNGAGKSTTIRTLLNFIQPTSGSAQILGLDIVNDSQKIREHIGYLSGDFRAYEKMTGQQFIDYMCGIQTPKRKTYSSELASHFQLNLNKRIGELSKGSRQKLGVIQAFMHEPEVIILDEPTDGLDPLMQEACYELIRKSTKGGATIFMSSHNLGEVKKVCDRVAIIKDGKLIAEQSITDLTKAAAQTLIVTFEDKPPMTELRGLPDTVVSKNGDGSISLRVSGSLKPIFKLLSKHSVSHIGTKEFDLEHEFMQFYETENK